MQEVRDRSIDRVIWVMRWKVVDIDDELELVQFTRSSKFDDSAKQKPLAKSGMGNVVGNERDGIGN